MAFRFNLQTNKNITSLVVKGDMKHQTMNIPCNDVIAFSADMQANQFKIKYNVRGWNSFVSSIHTQNAVYATPNKWPADGFMVYPNPAQKSMSLCVLGPFCPQTG